MVARAGVAAKFTFPVHSHMLRHACGFKLANDGHDTRAIRGVAQSPRCVGAGRDLLSSARRARFFRSGRNLSKGPEFRLSGYPIKHEVHQ